MKVKFINRKTVVIDTHDNADWMHFLPEYEDEAEMFDKANRVRFKGGPGSGNCIQ